MALFEDLAQGLAAAAGSSYGVEQIQKRKDRRQTLSDMELQSQTQQILGDVASLQERRSKLDPNSPTYQKDVQTIDQALHDARGVFTDLYHPQTNPGALAKLTGFIEGHLGKKKGQPAAPAQTPAQARAGIQQRIGGIEAAAYAPITPENPYAKQRREMKAAGFSDDDIKQALGVAAKVIAPPRQVNPSWKQYISPDGKDIQWVDLNDPKVPPGYKPLSPRAQQNAPKVGSFGDFLIQAYGPKPTAAEYEEGRRLWQQTGASTSVGEHVILVPQKDGTIVPVTVVTTTTKSFPGAGQTPGVPKTPGEARKILPQPHAGIAAQGAPVGGRLTAPQSKAQSQYNDAVALEDEVDSILDRQAKGEGVAVEQKTTLVRLERLAAGRFTQEAVNFIKSAGLGNSIQQWVNNLDSGELPEDVWRQVVNRVRDYVKAQKKGLETSGVTVPETKDESDVKGIVEGLKNLKKPKKPQ